MVLTVPSPVSSNAPPLQSDLEEENSNEDLVFVSQISVQGSSLHSYRSSFPEVSEEIDITRDTPRLAGMTTHRCPQPCNMRHLFSHTRAFGQPIASNSLGC